MNKQNRCETATRAYEERKRMKKLAGINENSNNIRPEIKDQIDQLVNNINTLADEIDSEFKTKVHNLGEGIKNLTDELKRRKHEKTK